MASSPGRGRPPPRAKRPSPAVAPADANSSNDAILNEMEEELAQKRAPVADPLEPVNRFMFGVNDVAYFWVLKPVFKGYTTVVPQPVRTGISNFFHNLATPARLVNCILQGKNSAADTELSRFAINTTMGVLGIGDPARDRWKLQPAEKDLGQTLAVYGLGRRILSIVAALWAVDLAGFRGHGRRRVLEPHSLHPAGGGLDRHIRGQHSE